jgi:hypothetical protein
MARERPFWEVLKRCADFRPDTVDDTILFVAVRPALLVLNLDEQDAHGACSGEKVVSSMKKREISVPRYTGLVVKCVSVRIALFRHPKPSPAQFTRPLEVKQQHARQASSASLWSGATPMPLEIQLN